MNPSILFSAFHWHWHAITVIVVTIVLAKSVSGATYSLTDDIRGKTFLDFFSYETFSDPTHGRVKYVDKDTAIRENLTFFTQNSFILRADNKKVLSPNGPGRDSFRIQSVQSYTTHVSVFRVRHMPEGCGTWPAIWFNGPNWPDGGEVDIVEGVNDQSPNLSSLHTSSGCSMPGSRPQTGTSTGNNCDVYQTGNSGCQVRMNDPASFGPEFNKRGGGIFALERRNEGIKIWFWGNGGSVPSDIGSGSSTIDTNSWGLPSAYFPGTPSCDIASHFGLQKFIVDLTFCGDWAGSVYPHSGCPSTCNDYVNNNPAAFNNAYFDFAYLKIFQ